MRTIAIKMRGYATGVNIVNNNNMEKRILNMLFISIGILAVLYIFILGTMVFNIIGRKTAEATERTLSNQVATLELQYLSASNKVDLSLSHSLGFTETKAVYATRKALGTLAIAKNEI